MFDVFGELHSIFKSLWRQVVLSETPHLDPPPNQKDGRVSSYANDLHAAEADKNGSNTRLFTFRGISVYASDRSDISDGEEFSCTLIDLYSAWLSVVLLPQHPDLSVRIQPTGVTQTILEGGLPLPSELLEHDVVLVPLNSDEDQGGHHWSLLLIETGRQLAYHYDSNPGINHHHAVAFQGGLEALTNTKWTLLHPQTPCNPTGVDCGPIVLCLMRSILHRVIAARAQGAPAAPDFGDADFQPRNERRLLRALVASLELSLCNN